MRVFGFAPHGAFFEKASHCTLVDSTCLDRRVFVRTCACVNLCGCSRFVFYWDRYWCDCLWSMVGLSWMLSSLQEADFIFPEWEIGWFLMSTGICFLFFLDGLVYTFLRITNRMICYEYSILTELDSLWFLSWLNLKWLLYGTFRWMCWYGKFRFARVVIVAHEKKNVAQFSIFLLKFRLEIFFSFLLLFTFALLFLLFWFSCLFLNCFSYHSFLSVL